MPGLTFCTPPISDISDSRPFDKHRNRLRPCVLHVTMTWCRHKMGRSWAGSKGTTTASAPISVKVSPWAQSRLLIVLGGLGLYITRITSILSECYTIFKQFRLLFPSQALQSWSEPTTKTLHDLALSYESIHKMSEADSGSDTPSQPETPGPDSIPHAELGEKHEDANIVDWDGPQDITNPQNWPSPKKWAHIIMVSLFALVT